MSYGARTAKGLVWLGGLLAACLALLGAPPADAQSAACLETGLGLYRGWHALSYDERARRCLDAERRTYERERLQGYRERDAMRLRQSPVSEYEWQRWRQQECLVNAAACDIPGLQPEPLPPPPPPPLPPPPPMR